MYGYFVYIVKGMDKCGFNYCFGKVDIRIIIFFVYLSEYLKVGIIINVEFIVFIVIG